MIVTPVKTRIFREGEDVINFILENIKPLKDGSILVVTSKIIALSERRTAVAKDERAKEKLIQEESEWSMETKHVWLTIKDGAVMPSAGIDESNANGKLILLPKDSFKTADALRKKLKKHYHVRRLGVLVTDSRTIPLRAGVSGVALGYAGFKGIRDYRKTKDIFGRKFEYSRLDLADSLASAAVIVMGEGAERQPLAVIEGAPVEFSNRVNRMELRIDIEDDMYGPLF
ncbi:MAG: coenzyme F420-0:L-glutamate ligase, partial [Patescibacteria group bacterium]